MVAHSVGVRRFNAMKLSFSKFIKLMAFETLYYSYVIILQSSYCIDVLFVDFRVIVKQFYLIESGKLQQSKASKKVT